MSYLFAKASDLQELGTYLESLSKTLLHTLVCRLWRVDNGTLGNLFRIRG